MDKFYTGERRVQNKVGCPRQSPSKLWISLREIIKAVEAAKADPGKSPPKQLLNENQRIFKD